MDDSGRIKALLILNVVVILGLFALSNNNYGLDLGSDFWSITGLSIHCKNTYSGVKCGTSFFEKKNNDPCAEGYKEICTNYCEMENVLYGADLVCPVTCENYCIQNSIAEKFIEYGKNSDS